MRKLKNSELKRPSIEELKLLPKLPIVLVLDNVRSLYNIGSIFRTGDAFRIELMHLCGITGIPPHREIQKTALGATESLHWKYFENVSDSIVSLREKKYTIVAVEQIDTSIDLRMFKPDPSDKYAFVFGNEIKGISAEILKYVDIGLEIPQFGIKHSFNVAISAGIVLWHIFYRLNSNT